MTNWCTSEIKLYSFIGTDSQITIPDKVDNFTVTEIGNSAFSGCSSLTEINIPESVTEIGNRAFQFCEELQNITIPKSIKKIGMAAFSKCEKLPRIIINGSITEMINRAVLIF